MTRIGWPIIFKTVKVLKVKGNLKNCSGVKDYKTHDDCGQRLNPRLTVAYKECYWDET